MPIAFGVTPTEPVAARDLTSCASSVARNGQALIDALRTQHGTVLRVREALRTAERQGWLYGIGRDYDPDGRGVVTNAKTGEAGWHPYGLAFDLERPDGSEVTPTQVQQIVALAPQFTLTSGGIWKMGDGPHVQHGICPRSPTTQDRLDYLAGRIDDVVTRYGADG